MTACNRLCAVLVAGALASAAEQAVAELPAPVRAMIDAAIASGSEADIAAVARVAKATNPADSAEIDGLVAAHRTAAAEAALVRKREARFYQDWYGSGEVGGFLTSGNTDSAGISAGIKLAKDGISWRHKLRLAADYQRSDGVTSRNQWLASYEPNFRLDDSIYLYGLTMYEKDRFQGFSDRMTASAGLGTRLIAGGPLSLDVKGGPAWRRTEWIDTPATTDTEVLGGADLVWRIARGFDFTNNSQIIWSAKNSTYANVAAFTAKLNGALSGRISYDVRHESRPPLASEKTDSTTRLTLVYGF